MADDDRVLVERLEEWEWTLRAVYKAGDLGTDEPAIVMGEASDRIEALNAENERLREALKDVSSIWRRHKYSGDFDLWLNAHIRAALGETK